MDVSRSEAKRVQTNVIARSVDRATTMKVDMGRQRKISTLETKTKKEGCTESSMHPFSFSLNDTSHDV
jgi:hypothetical protein